MIPISEVVVLTGIGLCVGGGFLIFLLIGDHRDAKRKATKEAQRRMLEEASADREGVWPPPIKHHEL